LGEVEMATSLGFGRKLSPLKRPSSVSKCRSRSSIICMFGGTAATTTGAAAPSAAAERDDDDDDHDRSMGMVEFKVSRSCLLSVNYCSVRVRSACRPHFP
jgi:hypothetical protein